MREQRRSGTRVYPVTHPFGDQAVHTPCNELINARARASSSMVKLVTGCVWVGGAVGDNLAAAAEMAVLEFWVFGIGGIFRSQWL